MMNRVAVVVPLYACFNIFIGLIDKLIDKSSGNAWQSHFALLELGVAHFARLELYSDGKYSITFARELAQLANEQHNRLQNDAVPQSTNTPASTGLTTPAGGINGSGSVVNTESIPVSRLVPASLMAWIDPD